jgi:hypothetical protein
MGWSNDIGALAPTQGINLIPEIPELHMTHLRADERLETSAELTDGRLATLTIDAEDVF